MGFVGSRFVKAVGVTLGEVWCVRLSYGHGTAVEAGRGLARCVESRFVKAVVARLRLVGSGVLRRSRRGMTSYVAVSRVAVAARRSIKQLYKEKRNGWFSKERTSKNY